jgi:hypothetical protein
LLPTLECGIRSSRIVKQLLLLKRLPVLKLWAEASELEWCVLSYLAGGRTLTKIADGRLYCRRTRSRCSCR